MIPTGTPQALWERPIGPPFQVTAHSLVGDLTSLSTPTRGALCCHETPSSSTRQGFGIRDSSRQARKKWQFTVYIAHNTTSPFTYLAGALSRDGTIRNLRLCKTTNRADPARHAPPSL